jgi:hypothetical protein
MLNSTSMQTLQGENHVTVATEASINPKSLKKLKTGVNSKKEIGVIRNLMYEKKSSVVTSLQNLNFGEMTSSHVQKTFQGKSDNATTKSNSVGNYTYNDLSYYLNKNAQQLAF